MSILISVVVHSTPSDDCVLCQLLNTLVILSLAMALDLGAAFISHFRSSQAALTSLEWSYYAMSLYFMAAGGMLAANACMAEPAFAMMPCIPSATLMPGIGTAGGSLYSAVKKAGAWKEE